MRKLLIILALLAVAAFASDPRLTVLGGDARLLVNDYLEMWAYPGTIGDYEFVTGTSQSANVGDGWFGIVDDFGGNTYGLTINHNTYEHEILFSPGGWGAILSMDFNKYAPNDTTRKDIEIGVAWGTDVPLFGDYSDLSFAVAYDKMSQDVDTVETGTSDIDFAASLRGHGDDFFNLFPIITMGVNINTNEMTVDLSLQTTKFILDFGAGHNKKVADRTNLVFGVFTGLESRSFGGDYVDEDSQMWITIPKITGGVEQEIGKWLIFRAGAVSNTRYYSKGDFNDFLTGYTTNFGFGMHWDNFAMDATISEGFLHSGPHMVGGNANGFMGSLAATYNF
ncbi:MAG: hypothetical protein KAR40_14075 [Candidatus Sabulitectum sp.]|nr:hypothetical protein [Candidatus Sabulitectum sp.]